MDDKNKLYKDDKNDENDDPVIIENNTEPETEVEIENDFNVFYENISKEISRKKEPDIKSSASRSGSGSNIKIPGFLQKYMYYIRIAGVLLIVSASIALMLAVVNAVTFDVIERTSARLREESVLDIFTDADSIEIFASEAEQSGRSKISVKNIYEVKKDSEVIGYCVNVASVGFGGEIDMMVGTDMQNQIVGVRIVSMSETPGLGTKTSDESFINQFKGISETFTIGENIDAVSGATISSKAVTDGVNAVLSLNLAQIPDVEGADTSYTEPPEFPDDTTADDTSPAPPETTEAPEIETEPPETQVPETQPPETMPPETQPPETQPPETQPPVTEPDVPVVIAPVETMPPETEPPETQPPETQPPVTVPPETMPPETVPPETQPPETEPPETQAPETEPPVTEPEPEETETEEDDWRPW